METVSIEATTLNDAWHRALYACVDQGSMHMIDEGSFKGQMRRELDYVTVHIKQPGVEPLEPQVNPALNIPDPVEPGYICNYLPYLMTDAEKAGEAYTYGQRLMAGDVLPAMCAGPEHRKPIADIPQDIVWYDRSMRNAWINQLQLMIHTYRTGGHRNNQMCLQVAQPADMLLKDPPCLRHIDTRIQDGALHFFPYFRSWDLYSGFPANLAAIELMKQYCADEIGVKNGEIIASSKGLHLYDYVFEIAAAIRGISMEEWAG
jgi:thymidylate synthase